MDVLREPIGSGSDDTAVSVPLSIRSNLTYAVAVYYENVELHDTQQTPWPVKTGSVTTVVDIYQRSFDAKTKEMRCTAY
ncbi:hypothetical protein HDU99_003198, partial [Rhizoclosmatium hyalinum]